MRRQFYELRPGQTVTIGGSRVTLEVKSGQRARLRIESNEPTALVDAAALARPQPPGAPAPSTPASLQRPTLPTG